MTSLKTRSFYFKVYVFLPTIFLFISVLNEFDFNYLNLDYFSFNFPFILIFFFTLKDSKHFDYLLIFIAGLINDVVIGIPMGVSSFCYLLICVVTAYLRNITITPNFLNDWIFLLITILLVNSIQVISLDLIFSIEVSYMRYFLTQGLHLSFTQFLFFYSIF